MESRQEHIATLCAVGTLGIAAAGLALGTSEGDTYLIKPGKRKAPGTNAATYSPISPQLPRPQTSDLDAPAPALSERIERRLSTSILRRKITTPSAATQSTGTGSRESSISRYGILRPWTSGERDTSTEEKEQRPNQGQTWLRRISSLSRPTRSSPTSSSSRLDVSPAPSRPSMNDQDQPNKLVKRSSSKRVLTSDGTTRPPALLRRPATSHQRSATLSGLPYTRPLTTESTFPELPEYISQESTWRPFFETGYSRKRHSSGFHREGIARTVSIPEGRPPTLLLGGAVEPRDIADMDDRPELPTEIPPSPPTRRHKMRRTLGSVRKGMPPRHFTDPIVRLNKDEAYGNIVPSTAFSNISPMSNISTFEIDLPHGTPMFTSTPPSYGPPQHRFTIPKRISVAPSDPTTASSDNDTRVFTDDDSMDFHSDTAYDSLATRATASSHSGFRQPKIETIFDEMSVDQQPVQTNSIEQLMQRATLDDDVQSISQEGASGPSTIGMGIHGLESNEHMQGLSPNQASTPVKSPTMDGEDSVSTPVPRKAPRDLATLNSSPPTAHLFLGLQHGEPELPSMMDVDVEDDIDWSPKSDRLRQDVATNVASSPLQRRFERVSEDDFDEQQSTQRSSIFDWSEHPKFGSDQSNGISPRPQTVHGKHGAHVGRSRASGRKTNAAMHLRSQSVPVNRDTSTETDTPSSATKFGTWALGSKPVSEEWSDDFEFDDAEEIPEALAPKDEEKAKNRESIRSVKVPQSIIDRQQSVHMQFGQVRDFMLLVEELKRLRIRGADLGLLGGYSRQLWEDAESIIDLATVNEDDDGFPRPPSPVSSDIFGDETPPPKRSAEDDLGRTINRRSISSPATPPFGRPRGESLQTKSFLQAIHHNRSAVESSPVERATPSHDRDKLPFDTQDLRDLVVRAGVITRALKEIVRKAEGVSLSPERPVHKFQEPVFRHIFDPPNSSPSPGVRKPGLPKSRSANSYLDVASTSSDHDRPQPLTFTTVVEAN
ncbi:hypothetical protein G647_10356 [Cladophialophora carrionii CBS 160.54]|uniref:Uncharacterized protein n=1 Tax=Cladophialophora carrionii CBS 160.54 TaxID=1279043 RepID=V9DJ14_9EURO|nr:uncharacterized protein G647_10356 [Cladophialophora carrionii CBS 160.54]ETI26696.1 hypothetical protein G647_10356 [Cladophialophora carrionii CBS 160.54]